MNLLSTKEPTLERPQLKPLLQSLREIGTSLRAFYGNFQPLRESDGYTTPSR